MTDPLLVVPCSSTARPAMDEASREEDPTTPYVTREWLVTNGLGGYASGTLASVPTRRYHGLLIGAFPPPLGRVLMLAQVGDTLHGADGRAARLSGWPDPPPQTPWPLADRTSVRLELGLPVVRYEALGAVVERRIWMPHRQNTVHVRYEVLAAAAPAHLELEPWIRFRPHDGPLDAPTLGEYVLSVHDGHCEVRSDGYPPLRMCVDARDSAFTVERRHARDVRYEAERTRGYESVGELYAPGFFRVPLAPGVVVTLVASAEPWSTVDAAPPAAAYAAERHRRSTLMARAAPAAREGMGVHLVLAADQFLITPPRGAAAPTSRVAVGEEARTVIAGYHWFTDWGRDTMISLEGLTLVTGRAEEASAILRTFAAAVRDGLIPNLFPEHGSDGLYHTADATLWFFHALDRYVAHTGDRALLRELLPKLVEIVRFHVAGTRFAIGVDARDGLLSQGASGYALTWMDAKVGDLVVTPRRGKTVEINALFYNALSLLRDWIAEERGAESAEPFAELASRARASFNRRFWYQEGGYLYDLVDGEHGDDASFRPNQVLAISLRHPVLEESRWRSVVDRVQERLFTPVGLRSLAPGHADYQAKYFGDLRARDLAYHQGTVWAWLVGPFVDAWLKVHGDPAGARALLRGFEPHLAEAGIGSISEIFDAEAPFTPRGCIAQAWSVAEVLRCLVATAPR